jgi:molecular chaperone GrpE
MSEERRDERPANGDGSAVPQMDAANARAADAGAERAGNGSTIDHAAAVEGAAIGDAVVQAQRRVVELEQRVAELERQMNAERDAATDYMNRWQRAQADFANLKRRTQQEQEQLQRLAGAQALAGVLPALDSFERAFATLPPSLRHFTWLDGIGLVHMQLHGALQAAGIRAFAPDRGSAFDPRREQTIGELETGEVAPGTVAVVVQQGYELGDLLLRPALVQLARAPQAGSGTPAGAASSQAPPGEARESGPEGAGAGP